jgi:thymidylate synthase
LKRVLRFGEKRPDRTGVGTISKFGEEFSVDLREGFPACTTKKLALIPMWGELACFVRGLQTLRDFHEFGCQIWDKDGTSEGWLLKGAQYEGDLGRIYGVQWRAWQAVTARGDTTIFDQLTWLQRKLEEDPFSRRLLVTAFNPGEVDQQCLPPCHVMFQCSVSADRKHLDMIVTMRSVDLFLGLPFDVASYATLQSLLAKDAGYTARWLTFHFGDAHIYNNHLEVVKELLTREPYKPPTLALAPYTTTTTFEPGHAFLADYEHHLPLRAELNTGGNGYEVKP